MRKVNALSISDGAFTTNHKARKDSPPMLLNAIRKSRFTSLLGLLALMSMASEALAANVHFKRTPLFTDAGQSLKATISLTGLGNQDVTITLQVSGSATYELVSPGGNVAPGQNKIPVVASTSVTIPSTQIKNGNVTVTLTTPAPVAPSAKEVGAPNNNWTARITDVSFSTATITVVQGGIVVLQQSFEVAP